MYKSKTGCIDLDTESLKSGTSRVSETTSARKAKELAKKTTRIIGGHGMAIRDSNKGNAKTHKLYCDDITQKEFGKDDNQGRDSVTWKNREKDWYNAERRFIFATQTKKDRKEWIKSVIRENSSQNGEEGMPNITNHNTQYLTT